MNGRMITVKGKGCTSAPPDWVKIVMNMEAKSLKYEKTLNLAAKQLEQLRKSLEEHGFDKKDLKTTSFNVDTSYRRVEDENGDYKRVFEGYTCSQNLYVGFEIDNKRLGSTLLSLSCCKSKPEFSIRYQLKDKKIIEEEILKNAIADATNKAKVIAGAADISLGKIISIDYSWSEVKFIRENFELMELSCKSSLESIDIEPDEIEASDTVSVVWEIK
ncbi:SIMPL domain-containing protein [uncultured Ilyobacter sp.]|uniref:SIMPL domain-containing protein n=1 Tax=uncultured Ilyobacter sp. TaxID=544433 RepID=UPI0029C88B5C|nr:SIMPL domain-containing protein [uncultured Ilyobacter sp.]